jgi:hypothetical protein
MAASVNEDRIAIDVYEHAARRGETLTLGVVERHLAELRGHQRDCLCGLCTAAENVRAYGG